MHGNYFTRDYFKKGYDIMTTTTTKRFLFQSARIENNKKTITNGKDFLVYLVIRNNKKNTAFNALNIQAVKTMQAYAQHGRKSNMFGLELMRLATIAAHCRLNTLIRQKDNTADFFQYKNDITRNSKFNTMAEMLNNCYIGGYDNKGNYSLVCVDAVQAQAINSKLEELTNSIGADLTSVATLELLEILDRAEKHGENIKSDFLFNVYQRYDTRSTTYSDGSLKPKELWKSTETNAIRDINRKISAEINAQRAIREQTALYTATEQKAYNANTETMENIYTYNKAPIFSAMEITDINGKVTTTTASNADSEKLLHDIPKKCGFTLAEINIYKYRYLDGMTIAQTAHKLKISVDAVAKHDRKIKDKIVKAEIFPQFKGVERNKKVYTAQKVAVKEYSTDKQTLENNPVIAVFPSLGKASKALNIDKGLISHVISGKREHANNLYFYTVE